MASLMGTMDRAAQRAGAFGRMRFIEPVSYSGSTGTRRAVYDQILAEYGLGGPFFVTSVSTPLLAATWGLVRAGVLSSPLPRASSEIIASAVAQAEACPFCVDVHSELASAGGERAAAALIARGGWQTIAERAGDCDRLALWARDFVRGGTAAPPPVAAAHAPYAVSVALTFVHVTTLVTIFQSDGLVAGFGGVKLVDRMAKLYMRTSLGKRMLARGPSPDPAAGIPDHGDELSGDFAFARGEPALARAWSALDDAVDREGDQVLSDRARQAVVDTMRQRCPTPPTLDPRFIDEALAGVAAAERGAARLAILAGTAPYRVTRADIDAAGPGGERGARWVTLAAVGVRARLHALAGRAHRPGDGAHTLTPARPPGTPGARPGDTGSRTAAGGPGPASSEGRVRRS